MTLPAARPALIGQRLVAAGLASSEQVEAALRAQRLVRGRLGYHLLRLGSVGPVEMGEFLEREVERGTLAAPRPPTAPPGLAAVPARVAQLYNVYPLEVGPGRLEIGVPPAAGQAVIEAVSDATGRLVEPRVLPARLLRLAIERDYLGGTRTTILPALAGLATFVVDDDLRHVRPLAPDLRTQDLSADAWLRSLVAEAVGARQRVIELKPDTAVVGADGACWPITPELHAALGELLATLSGAPAYEPAGPATRRVGAFQILVRGRRPIVTVLERSGPPLTWRLVLADQRLATEDADDLFADSADVQEGVEAFMASTRGLLLVCGPAGGGARRVARVLGERLRELAQDAVRIADVAGDGKALAAAGDEETAHAIHEAAERGSSLVLVDELPGPRSVERALLVAARRRVLAVLSAADSEAALAWLAHQGLAGALKTGLLRAVISILAVDQACSCVAPVKLHADVRARWGLTVDEAPSNAGCPSCFVAAVRRPWPVMTWTDVAGRAGADLTVEDEGAARAALHGRGQATTLDLAIERALRHGAEIGACLRLLAPPTA